MRPEASNDNLEETLERIRRQAVFVRDELFARHPEPLTQPPEAQPSAEGL